MNEPTQEEQLRVFNGIVSNYFGGNIYPYGQCREEDVCISIRALIEHGPEVSREWVEQLVNLILNTGEEYVVDFAIEELRERGVTVKGGK